MCKGNFKYLNHQIKHKEIIEKQYILFKLRE